MINAALMFGLGGLVVFVSMTVLWFRRAHQVAIPSNRSVFLIGWAGAGALGAVCLFSAEATWLSYIFGGLALFGGLSMLSLYALGTQKAGNPIMVGDRVPAFAAPDDQGQIFNSDALLGTPTLLKFFRGHW